MKRDTRRGIVLFGGYLLMMAGLFLMWPPLVPFVSGLCLIALGIVDICNDEETQ